MAEVSKYKTSNVSFKPSFLSQIDAVVDILGTNRSSFMIECVNHYIRTCEKSDDRLSRNIATAFYNANPLFNELEEGELKRKESLVVRNEEVSPKKKKKRIYTNDDREEYAADINDDDNYVSSEERFNQEYIKLANEKGMEAFELEFNAIHIRGMLSYQIGKYECTGSDYWKSISDVIERDANSDSPDYDENKRYSKMLCTAKSLLRNDRDFKILFERDPVAYEKGGDYYFIFSVSANSLTRFQFKKRFANAGMESNVLAYSPMGERCVGLEVKIPHDIVDGFRASYVDNSDGLNLPPQPI